MKKILLGLSLLPIFLSSQTLSKKISVLFLGNSYTYVNNLPLLIDNLASANGDTMIYDDNTPGGHTLNNHFNNSVSISKINSAPWKYVVIQGQSQEPSFSPSQVFAQTLPYAVKLDSLVKLNNSCSNTVFYETWGRKNGDASNCAAYPPVCTYLGMQNRLRQSYKKFADTCNAVMSPVGEAFRKSISLNPNLELYQVDQSHPSLEGSYLAACVFYEVLFQKSVLTNTFLSTLSATTTTFLQQVAHSVVNDSLAVWNLGTNLPWADYSYSGISGLNYQFNSFSPTLNNKWYFGSASTSLVANPNHIFGSAGSCTVSHVITNSCKKDSVAKIVVITPTRLDENSKNSLFYIYPNPCKDLLSIKVEDDVDIKNARIEIINLLGQIVFEGNYTKEVDVSELENGLYWIKFTSKTSNLNFQFVKSD